MEGDKKIVRFDIYCPKCENYNKSEDKEPCRDCLAEPAIADSRQPLKFKKK